MKQRMPSIYNNGNCRLCHTEEEDNAHMWSCHKSKAKREDIILHTVIANIENHLAQTDQIGYDNNRSTIRKAIECISALRIQEYNPYETKKALTKIYRQAYGTVNEIKIDEILAQGELIKFHHLCRGFAPEAIEHLIEILTLSIQQYREGIDRTTQTKSSLKAARKLYKAILEGIIKNAKEEIWKPRCDATIAWEKTYRITKKIKTNKRARAEYETIERIERVNDLPDQEHNEMNNGEPGRVDGDNTDDEPEEERNHTKPDRKKRKIADLEYTAGFHVAVLAGRVPIHRLVNPSKKGNMKGR
jgi:hypothetical protein